MQALRKTWFISDLHLDAGHPEITHQFMTLLQSCQGQAEDLYILGDLFELWIGDDDQNPLHKKIIEAMHKTAEAGTRLHFIRGNRDFLIGRKFLAATHCEQLVDETKITLYGTPVLLMHGDTLCTRDTAYLRARKFAHNRIIQTLFLWLPLFLRRKIAARARRASEKHTSTTEITIMDVTQNEVERVMAKHSASTLIHGHTHRPNIHHFTANHHDQTRIVLPAWHDGGTVFEWREDGAQQFIRCTDMFAEGKSDA